MTKNVHIRISGPLLANNANYSQYHHHHYHLGRNHHPHYQYQHHRTGKTKAEDCAHQLFSSRWPWSTVASAASMHYWPTAPSTSLYFSVDIEIWVISMIQIILTNSQRSVQRSSTWSKVASTAYMHYWPTTRSYHQHRCHKIIYFKDERHRKILILSTNILWTVSIGHFTCLSA